MFSHSKKFSLFTNIASPFTIAIIGSVPWMLFSQRLILTLLTPLALFAALIISDRCQDKKSRIRTVLPLALLILIQILQIHYGVIPEASPNHRTLFRVLLISIVPLIFVICQQVRIRNVITANVLVLLMGLVVIEGTLTVLSPKKSEQNKWSDLASQFDESPKPETNPDISIDGQHRLTTDQPKSFTHRVFFYGGSTTFNREVSDGDTYPSLTQKLLNKEAGTIKIENRGTIGASAVDLIRFLQEDETDLLNTNKGDTRQGLRRGDIVVFYIGVNEAKNAIVYRDPITRLSLQFSTFESASNWVFKHTNVGYSLNNLLAVGKASIDENNLAETKLALDTAESFTTDRGATFIPIIQPHVFTKSGPLKYEQAIRAQMNQFPDEIDKVYPRLADLVLSFENAADARNIFDNLKTSPYFDWCHVDKLGNKNIAELMSKVVRPFIIEGGGT